jgi:DNA helicase-2/ATP-dependent DNA helicase PcrA
MNSEKVRQFKEFCSQSLNPAQKQAVQEKDGAILIIAGAGSGKTRVITSRIINLILQEHVQPSSIVALTFTNKAANEMRERVINFLGTTHDVPFVGTFHSYCLRLIKKYSALLRKPFVAILDADDQHKILSGLIARQGLGKHISVKQLSYAISQLKNQGTGTVDESSPVNYTENRYFQDLYKAYEHEKTLSKCFDFDDLLVEVLHLFKTSSYFKDEFQRAIRHVVVDEYQDTNGIQHELLKQMACDAKKKFVIDSICVVGDEDQSIYSWRGATVANMTHFQDDFPGTKIITIDQNYRSVQPILQAANFVIQHNVARHPKNLWSDKVASNRIQGLACLSEYQEGEAIAQCIKVAQRKKKLRSMAILYRAHYQSRAIEEALIRHSVPYTIVGGIEFYERKEIKDMFAYLRLMVNPFDRPSFFRVVNCPARGLGEKFEELFYQTWNEQPLMTFIEVGELLIEQGSLPKAKRDALKNFLQVFEDADPTQKPSVAITHVVQEINYFQYLKHDGEEQEAQERIDNVKELLHAVTYVEDQKETTIASFLEDIALMHEKASKKHDADSVTLMTMHAAKGLEFDTVMIAGLEEGVLPNGRSLNLLEHVEEERRLFYVGITRAQEHLLITHARYRYTYGQMTDQQRSRFMEEIPSSHMPLHDCSFWKNQQFETFFNQWLYAGAGQQAAAGIYVPTRTGTTATNLQPTKEAKTTQKCGWKKNQPVQHVKFGIGTVQQIEDNGDGTVYITAQFKIGSKKIASSFLTPL